MKTVLWKETLQFHKEAETTPFMKSLVKGVVSPYEYYGYLCNLYQIYITMEENKKTIPVFYDLPSIRRAHSLRFDISVLEKQYTFPSVPLCKSADEYRRRILDVSHSEDDLLAHIYVRYMGDLSGGQILKGRLAHFSTKFYDFENVDFLKSRLSSKLKSSMAEEANEAFKLNINLFKELYEVCNEQNMGLSYQF